MVKYQPDAKKEYRKGSSDRPHSPRVKMPFVPLSDVDEKLQVVNTRRHLTSDKELDVEATNNFRIKYIRDNRLTPLKQKDKMRHYRSISRDREGLIKIDYHVNIPPDMEAIHNDEKIPLIVAAEYTGMELQVIRTLIKNKIIKGNSSHANLADINQIKK